MKNKTKIIATIIVISSLMWMSITNIIQAIKCPKMTQTELFLHIPKSFVCEWKVCK